ncbi:MAG: creatininase family protein [Eubacterium sp.]
MKNTNWIMYMSSSEFAERKQTCDTVIVPVGATEVYGPHMPMGSDIIVAKDVAGMVADKVNAMIGPSLEVGESYSLTKYPGTMYLRPSTWSAVFKDYMDNLIRLGFKNILIINGHAGNVPIIGQICRPLEREYGIKTAQVDWWRFTQKQALGVCETEGWMCHGHASECGTSVMLYLHPDYVDMSKAARVTPKEGDKYGEYDDFIEYTVFNETTECGILGDATIATAEKGEQIINKCVNRIVEFMKDRFGC